MESGKFRYFSKELAHFLISLFGPNTVVRNKSKNFKLEFTLLLANKSLAYLDGAIALHSALSLNLRKIITVKEKVISDQICTFV